MIHTNLATPSSPVRRLCIHALLAAALFAASPRAIAATDAPLPQPNPTTQPLQILESVDELPVDLQVRADYLTNAFVHKRWHDTGHILAGRLLLDRGVSLHSRAAVFNDGTFCAAVFPSRTLTFYAHGYEPLVLTPSADTTKSIAWYGDIAMVRVPAKDLAQVKGVAAANPQNADAPITARLSLAMPPETSDDGGNDGSSPRVNPLVATKTLRPGETFTFTGLSPLPYVLTFQQPGSTDRTIPLTPKRGETLDLRSITLEQATTYTFRYIARTRPTAGQWQTPDPVATAQITCNGTTTFLFSQTRDRLGNKLHIRLTPRDKQVVAMFYFGPGSRSFFHDLGTLPVDDPAQLPEAEKKATPANRTGMIPLQKGHTYFFTVSDVNGIDAQCLFKVE